MDVRMACLICNRYAEQQVDSAEAASLLAPHKWELMGKVAWY